MTASQHVFSSPASLTLVQQLVANMEASAREARAKAAASSKLKDLAPSKDVWGADVAEDVELDEVCFGSSSDGRAGCAHLRQTLSVGGTCCADTSVRGLRQGFDGTAFM